MEEIAGRWGAFEASPYFWDWITLVCLAVAVIGFLAVFVWILGLPGRIAYARNHPDAEAVYLMGWVGFAAIIPWIQALIWAFKPTDKVDIRRLPEEERAAERAELDELGAYAYGRKPPGRDKPPAPEPESALPIVAAPPPAEAGAPPEEPGPQPGLGPAAPEPGD